MKFFIFPVVMLGLCNLSFAQSEVLDIGEHCGRGIDTKGSDELLPGTSCVKGSSCNQVGTYVNDHDGGWYDYFCAKSHIVALNSGSASSGVIVEKTTTNAKGGLYNNDGRTIEVPVTSCTYTVADDLYNNKNVRVYVNSDEDARTNFGFGIPRSEIPLTEGSEFRVDSGYKIHFRDGVLEAKRFDNDGPFSKDTNTIRIEVSADLMEPKQVNALATVGSLVRSIKFKEIKCSFNKNNQEKL